MTVLSTMTDDELLVKWANRREEEARALLHRPSGVNASAYLDELRRRLAAGAAAVARVAELERELREALIAKSGALVVADSAEALANATESERDRLLAENTRLRGEVELDTSRHESEIGYWLGSSQERKAKIANLAAENTRLRGEVEALTRANAEDRAGRYADNTRLREERNEGNSRGLIAEREVARLTEAVRDCADRLANNFDNENIVASVAVDLRAALSGGGTDASSSAGSETCQTCDGIGCVCFRTRDWQSIDFGCSAGCPECGRKTCKPSAGSET